MSDYSTNSTVNLSVNGKEVEDKIKKLEKQLNQLHEVAENAVKIGDKGTLQKTQKEIIKVENQMRKVRTATANVEETMRNLDKARPNNIKKDLQTLKAQLNGIERGSEAWDAHIAKIKALNAELKKINSEMKESEGFWDSFNRKMNDWQTTIAAGAAAITGIVMAGRSATSAFAEMDAELANVRKFTGMTKEEVELLNEEFKKMDTRTSREGLNALAEEAGRLGKTSVEDVLGFVKAADKINVALDDLGEGATLTLSKLTNIFGDEQRLGTEEALLSVGSVINELSQNCTAAAPYLANFAQRMAGVGAQAGLTIPQIMAFGAVLDSQGQAAEMSATSLSKLTMDLFKDTEKVAKATGIPLKQLQDALSKSTNEGLMLLLEKLHDLGDMSVLAPVFKDMGENGARASQVIAALAGNIETLKWQQEEANKAYNDASSVTKEYNVQNTTVQASLDKAKKRVAELAIELGEKLMPVMRHVISSTTLILKMLSTIVDFVIKYKTAIVTATASVVAYTLAVEASNIAFKAHYAWLVVTQAAQKAFATVLATVKTAWVLLRLAMAKIEGNYARVKLLQTELNTAMKANAIGLIIAGVIALIAAFKSLNERMKEQNEAQEKFNNAKRNALANAQDEIDKINTLREAAENENLALDKRKQAVENLNKIIPGYNAQIDETTGKLVASKKALDNYIDSLIRQYEVQGAREEIQKLGAEVSKLDDEIEEAETKRDKARNAQKERADRDRRTHNVWSAGGGSATGFGGVSAMETYQDADLSGEISSKRASRDAKQRIIDKYKKKYGNELIEATINDTTNNNNNNTGGGNPTADDEKTNKRNEDKFKAEKEWKEREEALNIISYVKGEKNYQEYTEKINQIALEFYDKQLQHTDLSEQERIVIEGEKAEELLKQKKNLTKHSIEEEELRHQQEVSSIKQKYVDEELTQKQYELSIELAELEHLSKMKELTEKGSKERADAEKRYLDKMFEYQKKKQAEQEKAEEKLNRALRKFKEEYFGETYTQRMQDYDKQITWLNLAYKAEIDAANGNSKELKRIQKAYEMARLDIMKKYNKEALRENQNFLQNFNDDMQEWLRSDAGQAVMSTAQVLIDGMSQIFSQLTSMIQAEMEIQENAIERRYEKEVSLAEGNNYTISALERQKEKDIAKIKNDANKKMYNMQVIQAVAQTAQAAINAYSSAAAVPVVGYILAPIAAAMAVTAGELQVSNIKKQQQAASSGYASGGYTPKGPKYKEVGVVHAGEWVASQELLANPRSAAIIQSLDYAQRTNTIGSLSQEMVNEDLSANIAIARSSSKNTLSNADNISKTLSRLNDRLNEPFVTVNTITGDKGIKKAYDDYDILIANKSPKR